MNKILLTIVALLAMSHLLHSQVIDFNLDTTTEMTQKVETNKQIIKVSYSSIQNDYIKITTVLTAPENMAVMYVSKHTETPNIQSFSYIAREKNINTIYVPKPYLMQGETPKLFFHIGVECPNNCDYKITISFEKTITMELDTKYQYLTDVDSVTVTMRVNRLPEDNVLLFYAIGGYKEEIVNFDLKYHKGTNAPIEVPSAMMFYNGEAAVLKEKDVYVYREGSYYELILQTSPKSYIALGVRKMDKVGQLIPFEVTYGLIQLTENQRDCLKVTPLSSTKDHQLTLNVDTVTENAFIYLAADENSEPIDKDHQWTMEYSGFILINENILENNLICIRKADKSQIEAVSYTLHLVDNFDSYNTQALNLPRVNSLISMHYLPQDSITYYRYYKRTLVKNNVSMTLKVFKGTPRVYAHVNTNFPELKYTKESIDELDKKNEMIKAKKVNDFYYLLFEDKGEDSLVSPKQNVIIINCHKEEAPYEDCEFQLSFTDETDSIILKPNAVFNSFVFKGVEDHYTFTIEPTEPPITQLIIELCSFSGDSSIRISFSEDLQTEKINIGNKQVLKVTSITGSAFDLVSVYFMDVYGHTDSYYSIIYIPINTSTIKNLESGSALLEPIAFGDTNSQVFHMKNKKKNMNTMFVTTFLPLNCKISVKLLELPVPPEQSDKVDNADVIQTYGDQYQHEVEVNSLYYNADYIPYEVSIVSMKETKETVSDTCMVYISGNQVQSKEEDFKQAPNPLLLTEASSHQMVISTKSGTAYIYPHHLGDEADVIIDFILDDGLVLSLVTISIDFYKYKSLVIKGSRSVLIRKMDLNEHCQNKAFVCNISVHLTGVPSIENQRRLLNISIRSTGRTPGYLNKNQLYSHTMAYNTIQYHYTYLNQNEEADVYLHYKRGSVKMFARLVQKEVFEENPDWNDKIILPTETSPDLLSYDAYLRKITITTEQSSKCIKGCELYIGVKSEDENEQGIEYLVDYSIVILKKSAPIDIKMNEFVSGQLKDINQRDVYQFTIPTDTLKLRITFQSEVCVLLVKRGLADDTQTYDWKYEAESNGLFIIEAQFTQNEIISFTLKTDHANTMYVPVYMLSIDIPVQNRIEIKPITSDRNVLCKTFSVDSYCYFQYLVNSYDMINQVSMYGFTEDISSIAICASIIEMSEFDKLTQAQLEEKLPKKETAPFTSDKQLIKDVLIVKDELLKKDSYMLIGVFVSKSTILNFFTTFRTQINKMPFNPIVLDLFAIDKKKSMEFKLLGSDRQLVNIAGLIGKAKLEVINGEGNAKEFLFADKRYITLETDKGSNVLRITSEDKFVFTITYTNSQETDFNEIEETVANEIISKEVKFPLVYYTEVYDETKDIIINLNINSLIKNKDNTLKDEFEIKGIVTDVESIKKKKRDKDLTLQSDQAIIGSYYNSVTSGRIVFASKDIMDYPSELKKYLYVTFDRKTGNTNTYTEIHSSASVSSSSNDQAPIATNTYFHDTLLNDPGKRKLFELSKHDGSEQYLKFEFSSNAAIKNVNFIYVSTTTPNPCETKTNSTDFTLASQENKYGKRTIVFDLAKSKDKSNSIYICVFFTPSESQNESEVINETLSSYFTLRYSTSVIKPESKSLAKEGKVTHTYTKDTKNLKLQFGRVIDSAGVAVKSKYSLRIIPIASFNNAESYKSITVVEDKNPVLIDVVPINKETMEVSYDGFPDDKPQIVSILATAELDGDMLMYDIINDPVKVDPVPDLPSDGFPDWAIAVIVVVVLILIGVGVLFYFKKCKKHESNGDIAHIEKQSVGLIDKN